MTAIEVVSSTETAQVGTPAFDIMIPQIIEANGTGVDMVSGATFSSRALKNAVNDAAQQAGCTNLAAFQAGTVEVAPDEAIEGTWDVVIVGAGGAGIAAAAQAAQDLQAAVAAADPFSVEKMAAICQAKIGAGNVPQLIKIV